MPRHPPNAQKNKQHNTRQNKRNVTEILQKSYSKMLASTIQFTTNPPTPTPHHPPTGSRSTGQATRAHCPRTPTACHPHTRTPARTRGTHHNRPPRPQQPQQPTTSRRVSYTTQHHNQPTPHNSARPASRSLRARHPLQAGPDHTGPDKTNNQKRRRRQTAPHKPILRKEVIQPHLPVRLPCYDFVPITSPTFDRSP